MGANEVTRLRFAWVRAVRYNKEYLRVVYPLISALSPSRMRDGYRFAESGDVWLLRGAGIT